ncbi:MAG: serine hydrolase [Gemmatimonadota bacterium]
MKSQRRWRVSRGRGLSALGGLCLAAAAVVALPGRADSYPLDGYERTGIRRLRVYRQINDGALPGNIRLKPGAQLPSSAIRLRLADTNPSFDVGADTPRDAALQEGIERIVGRRHSSYRVAVLDITDPQHPRYAAVKPNEGYIPGSVGKLLVMTGLFNELRKRFPTDLAAREELLRTTRIVADAWVMPNSHEVPVVNEDMTRVTHRSIRIGDEFTLWEWLDHMVSPSSNAAGSMVWKHVLLMNHFGSRYPVSKEEEDAFFANTPKAELTDRAIEVLEAPLREMGLDTEQLRLRTFFTRGAERIIPGRSSYATPQELVRWLLKLEQGKVVDRWSSEEMKRLLYFTRRRYRYAFSPELDQAAVYFKSGSLYRCRPEEGYSCGQYRGNAENLMHAVAIVEAPARPDTVQHVYLISMMSNVLKVNSASEHAELGTQIERFIRGLHVPASGSTESSAEVRP